MALAENELIQRALGSLSEAERSTSIVYFDPTTVRAGKAMKFGNVEKDLPWNAVTFFVDLEPGVNWGHKCRYILINLETGEQLSFPATMPPFLKGTPPALRVVWLGPSAPAWAKAAP
jgi:hypothetical protein